MKLNYRDKVLLLTLIVIAVWVAGIMLFIKPAIDDVKAANTERDEMKAKLKDLQATIEADKNLANDIKVSYANAVKYSKPFYDYMLPQNASQKIDQFLDDNKLINSTMKVSEYTSYGLNAYQYASKTLLTDTDKKIEKYNNVSSIKGDLSTLEAEEAAAANAIPETIIPPTLANYEMEVDFHGSYDEFKKFCQKLTVNTEHSLVISEMELKQLKAKTDSNEQTSKDAKYELEGTVKFNMMMMRKLPALK